MRNCVLLYNEGLSTHLIYSELLANHPELFSAVIRMPLIPLTKKTNEPSRAIKKKLLQAPVSFLVFNAVVSKGFGTLARVTGHSIRDICRDRSIAHESFESTRQALVQRLTELSPDWVFNCSSIILDDELIGTARRGVLNYHCAPLPEYRGPANYFWLLLEKARTAQATLHHVDSGVDTGDIVALSPPVPVNAETTVFGLWSQLRLQAYPMFRRHLDDIASGRPLPREPQDPSRARLRTFPTRRDMRGAAGLRIFGARELVDIIKTGTTGQVRR